MTTAGGASAPLTGDSSQAGFIPTSLTGYLAEGYGRMAGPGGDPTRNVTAFTPPPLSSGDALNRYRMLSKFSPPANSGANPDVSLYGEGQGVYIDNPEDREKLWDTTSGTLKEMDQYHLTRLWFDPSGTGATNDPYMRLGTPVTTTTGSPVTNANGVIENSLEEQHLRGWVSQDEFRPRGALVELGNDQAAINNTLDAHGNPMNPTGAVVYITLDSRTDNATTATDASASLGPVDAKS
jgi:hypothetical protein